MTKQKYDPLLVTKVIYDYIFLFEFLKILKPKNSLEIGVHKGLTFQLLHKYSTHSLGIEIDHTKKVRYVYPPDWNIIYKDSFLINQGDLGPNTIFDFMHIDGDHDYETVINDLEKCLPHMSNTTIICMDDYTHEVGVSNAIQTFLKSNKNFFLKSIGISQAFLVTEESEIMFDKTVADFKKETVNLLKLKPILHTLVNPIDEMDIYIIKKMSKKKQFEYLQNIVQEYLKRWK